MGQTPSSRCKQQKAKLVRAVKSGDLATLEKVLTKAELSINNVRDSRGCPLLCLAARVGDPKMVSILLQRGAPKHGVKPGVKRGVKQGWEVHLAYHPEQAILTKLLVNMDAQVSDDEGTHSGYYNTSHHHHKHVFSDQEAVNVNVTDRKGLSPVHITAINGSKDIAQVLVDQGADVNKPDCLEASPLHAAAAYAHEDICTLLLERGALVNSSEKSGLTPLHLAVMTGGVAVVRLLLHHGALPYIPDGEGRCPVHFSAVLSAFRGLDDVVRTNRSLVLNLLLLKYGGNITYRDDSKCSPLSYALIKDNMRLVRMYLDFGLRLDKDDHSRMSTKHPHATARYEQEVEEDPDTRVPSLYRCCRRSIMTHLADTGDHLTDSKLYNSVSQLGVPSIVQNFLKFKI